MIRRIRLPLLLSLAGALAAPPAAADPPARLGPILSRLVRGQGVRVGPAEERRPVDREELRLYARALAIDAESTPPRLRVWMRLDAAAKENARRLPGVALQADLGELASAIVPLPALAALAAVPGIEWMQIPRRPRPELDVSVPEIGADVVTSTYGLRGRGVNIGIIDSGLDYTHDDFRFPSGNTHVAFLWDQTVDCGNPPAPFTYGCLYTRSDVDAALDGMGTVIFENSDGHGTQVTGIAGGDGSATGNGQPSGTYAGVADAVVIIAVKVFPEPGDDCPLCDLGDALAFVDQKSAVANRPWVANMSLGFDLGGHDGSDPTEQVIDALTGPGIPGKAVVKSAGNNRGRGIHMSGVATAPGVGRTFTIPAYTPAPGIFDDLQLWQMWYDGADDLTLRITSPAGFFLETFTGDCVCTNNFLQFCTVDAECAPGGVCDGFLFADFGAEGTVIFDQTCTPSANGSRAFDMEIDDQLSSPPASGTWTFTVSANSAPAGGRFDAWIWESTFGLGQEFVPWDFPDPSQEVTIPGTAFNITTVASYATKSTWTSIDDIDFMLSPLPTLGEISSFSSPGPSRDGRQVPHVAAPGQIVASALSADAAPAVLAGPLRDFVVQDGVHWLAQGTSFAAPHVTGVYAQMLELNPDLDAVQLRTLVTGGARTDGFTGAAPNDDWGFGKLDAVGAIDNLIKPIDDLTPDAGGTFSFSDIPQADTYHVFRVDLSALDGTDYGTCIQQGLATTTFVDAAVPAAGDGFGYTVAGEQDGVPGLIGFQSDGSVRPRPSCP